MKVFVLGHRGMLGHVVARYLREQSLEVFTSDLRYTGLPTDSLIEAVRNSPADWVVNAIGKVDVKSTPTTEMMLVNAQLPVHLKSFLRPNQRMIHASSDGVFSGKLGNYDENAERDAEDVYGLSKILAEVVAEPGKALVIRCSIIGPASEQQGGLMQWMMAQSGTVKGFTNHLWNGITTLEWAKISHEIITGKFDSANAIVQAASAEPLSKFEILRQIAQTWDHAVKIEPAEAPVTVNRALNPTLKRAPLLQQLQDLKAWV